MVPVICRDYRKGKESFPGVGVNLERVEAELVGVFVLLCLKLQLGSGKHSRDVFFSIWRGIRHHRTQYAKNLSRARYFLATVLTRKSVPSLIVLKVSSSSGMWGVIS